MQRREQILQTLRARIRTNGHSIGVAAGSGMTARYAVMGGADFILALSAGKFRQVGQGSIASLLCYANSNELVMNFGTKELLPAVPDTPVIFGLNASDPTIHLYEYLQTIAACGFSGVNNFPTIGLIDGTFRRALEQEEGMSYAQEVEAIRLAHFIGLFTIAFVFNEAQAAQMLGAGADVICVHLGLTVGGKKGAKKADTLEQARIKTDRIFDLCDKTRPGIIKMIYGGPISNPADVAFFYHSSGCMGYIGGSAFERIPIERAILETTQAFQSYGNPEEDGAATRPFIPRAIEEDAIAAVRGYIEANYQSEITLRDMAAMTHLSPSYLSTKFKKETGYSFSEYLLRHRLDRAAALIRGSELPLVQVADRVGYRDYAQFSKMFKKYRGLSPAAFRNAKAAP